ncbi:hypothetical protein B0O80DRAFT_119567 [Mortierella sp. GBAus27b]|nr:hypothetical protein B0O80DRAFT_119567 [Mortierella sp. GBAus27b]
MMLAHVTFSARTWELGHDGIQLPLLGAHSSIPLLAALKAGFWEDVSAKVQENAEMSNTSSPFLSAPFLCSLPSTHTFTLRLTLQKDPHHLPLTTHHSHPAPSMEATQSFRLAGSMDIVKITYDQEDGQNVIYWDDILGIFPGAQYVKNGDVAVKKMRTNGPGRDKAQRIKHHPGVVLDVVLSTRLADDPTESPLRPPRSSATTGQTSGSTEAAPASSTDDSVIENVQVSTLDSTIHMETHGDCHTSSSSVPGLTSSSVNIKKDSTMLLFKQAVQLDQEKAPGSTFEQRLVPFLPHDVQAQVTGSSDAHDRIIQAIQNGLVDRPHEQLVACLQDLKDVMDRNNELVLKNNGLVLNVQDLVLKINELTLKNNELTSSNMESTALVIKMQEAFKVKQDEMKQLQIQALDQLALLQNRVQALMTQTYELHEYPIPRLFVVLPQDTSSWNPVDIVSNKFRLYFLCECGEHTRQSTSKISHHIHLAKHEGYEITRPKEFFRQFGRYILTILKMLKFGVSVAGVAIPAVSLLVRADALDKATSSLKMLTGNLQTGLEQSIGCIEKLASDNGEPCDRALDQLANNEGLEGADLRKLETFLKNKDGSKVLGNLYRTTTSEGHVKWVCIDHYRENYHEKASKTFRDTVESMGGAYDENIGRVNIHVRSKIQADRLYQALDKARSVYELEIGLDWDTTYSDFKKLRDCLLKSNVGALHINLHRQKGPATDALNRGKRHDPIMDIMQHPSTHSVSIMEAPDDFIRRSSLLSRNDDYPNLKNLEIDLTTFRKDVPGLKKMITRIPNLTSLTMNESEDKRTRVCSRCGTEDGLRRSLQVNDGRVKVYVCSGLQADLAYQVLEVSKSINGLNIGLVVDLKDNTADDISDSTQRYDSILNIMRHPSTHSLVIRGALGDFIQRSTLLANNDGFPNLKHLDINFSTSRQHVSSLKTMISRMSNLTCLIVNDSGDRRVHICDGCDTVGTLERSFEVIDGRVKIIIRSLIQAELVFQVLENNTSISGLDIDLHVELKDESGDGIIDRTQGHDAIFDIMQHPCTHSVIIVEPPEDFIQQSSFTSWDYRFPNVKHLIIDLSVSEREIPGLKTMVSRMPNITSLTVNDSDKRSDRVDGASDTEDSFERLVKVNGGRATVNLRSRIQSDLVYPVLENIQSIYGLGIDLFVDLKDITNVDTSHRIQQHDSILDIMRHPSTHSVVMMNAPEDFIRQSSILSRNDDFSHLKRLDIDISALKQDTDGITNLISRMSNLSHLGMNDSLYTRGQFHGGIMAMESLNGPFDTNCDRVIVHVESRELVELAYNVLEKVKTAYELDLGLYWSITQGDMDRLRGILARTNISSLKLHANLRDDSTSEVSDRIQRHDSFFDILRHPSTHSVVMMNAPRDLIQQSSIMSQNKAFNLKRLYIDVSALGQDINVDLQTGYRTPLGDHTKRH